MGASLGTKYTAVNRLCWVLMELHERSGSVARLGMVRLLFIYGTRCQIGNGKAFHCSTGATADDRVGSDNIQKHSVIYCTEP